MRFDTAVFSNLSRDHLDYHQDMEDYFLAKAQLFARPIRHALINTDDAYGRRLIEERRIHPQAEIWSLSAEGRPLSAAHHQLSAQDVRLNAEGLAFTLHYKEQSQAVQSRLLARFNVANLLNVAACLLSGGQDLAQTAVVLARLQGVPGRVEKIDLGEGRAAIVDYAHTAGAIESVLQGIRPHVQGKLSLIFGCGGDRDAGKRPLMAAAAERFADTVIVTDDNPRSEDPQAIIADIMQGFEAPEKVQIIQPREAAIRTALEQLQAGDTLLIAGKGHENYQIIGTSAYEYSDQAVIRAWKTK
ncbi:UDP-N-acetylmuramoyl-L-alanyl-D-glutamate--2,6-diaminopimelate ligase [Brevundimonas vesicularis]|uniref:UDP-N-acetylmuramoyl-L-alanyl-D-glutamate--2,6-diaminopimelate ligase n=1 Tax=Brevundimonas vesicularis TaxID=41276 RepID=A0A2X1BPE8_BREVE|nr:UDP-N-acetylmuramoyl-L-alanyl-D-glutamate--2,6-diaminopimelate ligase [Brevundimonas vesicularis]